jgi:hypothetical protein
MKKLDRSSLEYWMNLINKRGHAGAAARSNKDKEIIELNYADEWANSMEIEFEVCITDLISNVADPPDCLGRVDDQLIGIELMELVQEKILIKIAKAWKKHNVRLTSDSPQIFNDALWSRDKFQRLLAKGISAKQDKYEKSKNNFVADYLVIYSEEPYLMRNDVTEWLKTFTLPNSENLKKIYLLLSYDPSQNAHYPIFELK